MNVKELKELAERWDHAARGSMTSANAAWAMYKAIMALPDDPPAEHQDLVEMARKILNTDIDDSWVSDASNFIADFLKRFGKKDPDPALGSPECWGALYRRVAILESRVTRIARVIATEEV